MFKSRRQLSYERPADAIYYTLNWIVTRFEFYLFGFPRVEKKYSNSLLDVGVSEAELKEYYYPEKLVLSQIAFALTNAIVVLKNLFPVYYVLATIHSIKRDYLNPDARVIRFGCLETNCTARSLQKQLTLFPAFSICKHNYQWLYPPLTGIQPIGLSLHCIYVYFVLVFNVITLLHLYYYPYKLDTHLFAMSPVASIRWNCEIIRKSLTRTYLSLTNLQTQCPRLMYVEEDPIFIKSTNSLVVPTARALHRRSDYKFNNYYFEKNQLSKFTPKYMSLEDSARHYIEDCLTSFRSDWWHRKSIRLTFFGSVIFLLGTFSYVFLGLVAIQISLTARLEDLKAIISRLNASGCKVYWQTGDLFGESDLVRTFPGWSYVSIIEASVALLPGVCFAGVILSWYQQCLFDLWSMVSEQIDRIIMTIEVTNQLKAAGLKSVQGTANLDNICELAEMYSFRRLKRLHMENPTLGRPLSSLKAHSCIYGAPQSKQPNPISIGAELVEANGPNIAAFQELLTKIHTCNNFLISTFRELNSNVEIVLLVLFSITYGFVAIIIYINRQFSDTNGLTILIGIWSIFINSSMVFLPSKIHSVTKQLVNLMWRLMVATIDFEDMRIRHLRTLMLKQLKIICHERDGGLALRACGIPLTYGFVIKLALWSATMIVISFGP